MSNTSKIFSERDANQTLQAAFNDVDASLTSAGFLVGKVGRKVIMSISTTTVASDTQTYAFSENGTALYSLKLIFTDNTYATLISAERTA